VPRRLHLKNRQFPTNRESLLTEWSETELFGPPPLGARGKNKSRQIKFQAFHYISTTARTFLRFATFGRKSASFYLAGPAKNHVR
jgi:hypothetical protein